jgi:hypothetical protein
MLGLKVGNGEKVGAMDGVAEGSILGSLVVVGSLEGTGLSDGKNEADGSVLGSLVIVGSLEGTRLIAGTNETDGVAEGTCTNESDGVAGDSSLCMDEKWLM